MKSFMRTDRAYRFPFVRDEEESASLFPRRCGCFILIRRLYKITQMIRYES